MLHEALRNPELGALPELLALQGPKCIGQEACQATLYIACSYGHLPAIKALLSLGGDRCLDVSEEEGAVWITACRNGCLDAVDYLLGLTGPRRVDVHAQGGAALTQAVDSGRTEVTARLLGLEGDREMDVRACIGPREVSMLVLQGYIDTLCLLLSLPFHRSPTIGDFMGDVSPLGFIDPDRSKKAGKGLKEILTVTGPRGVLPRYVKQPWKWNGTLYSDMRRDGRWGGARCRAGRVHMVLRRAAYKTGRMGRGK